MKLVSILGMFLFVLLMPVCIAETESTKVVFQDSVISGSYATSDGFNFTINVNEITDKVYVAMKNGSLIVENGGCSSVDDLIFCVDNISQSDNFSMEFFRFFYKAELRVLRKVPTVFLTEVFPKSSLTLGEEMIVRIEFGNRGILEATDVEMEYRFPSAIVDILKVEGCQLSGSSVVWRGELRPHDNYACVVRVKAKSPGYGDAKGDLIYFDGTKKAKMTTRVRLRVGGYAVELTSELSNGNLTMGGQANFTVTLKRKSTLENFEYRLYLPEGATVVSAPAMFQDKGDYLSYSEVPSADETHKLVLKFDYIGTFEIMEVVSYIAEHLNVSFTKNTSLLVNGNRLSVVAYNPVVMNGTGEFFVSNPSQSRFGSVTVNYAVGSRLFSKTFETVEKRSHRSVKFPYNGSEPVNVSVSLSYFSESGQRLVHNSKLHFTVAGLHENNSMGSAGGNAREIPGQGSSAASDEQESGLNIGVVTLGLLGIMIGFFLMIWFIRKRMG